MVRLLHAAAAVAFTLLPPSALAVSAVSNAMVDVSMTGAGQFAFQQPGFGPGGMVSGSFTAWDLDQNGQISSLAGEVAAFALSFSGNGEAEAFTLGFDALEGLVYDLDGDIGDGLSGHIEGIVAMDSGGRFYLAGALGFRPCGDGTTCAILEDGVRQAVVAPTTALLLGAGLAAAAASLNRRRRDA